MAKGARKAEVRDDRQYTRTHLWCKISDDVATIGMTEFAVRELSADITFVELPEAGDDVLVEIALVEVETRDEVLSLFSPVDGVVLETHAALEEAPGRIKKDPYNNGWLVRIRVGVPAQLEELLSPEQYRELIAGKQ